MKKCSRCKIEKDEKLFYGSGKFSTLHGQCIACENRDKKRRCLGCEIEKPMISFEPRNSRCKECRSKEINEKKCSSCGFIKVLPLFRKNRDICLECSNKTKQCLHGKYKVLCEQCGASQICSHKRQKAFCKECMGSQICRPHQKIKRNCIECNGPDVCFHRMKRSQCRLCEGCSLCINCKFTRKNQKYKPYCSTCYYVLNPDFISPRQFKTKEYLLQQELIEYIEEADVDLEEDPVFDKVVDNGCSKRRPDIRIERLTHTIIIECDENQHKSTSCENKRMMELFQDLGSRNIVFLRFNPDSYKETGVRKQGCFDKEGKLVRVEWEARINLLKEKISHHLSNIPDKEVTVENLFYDI